MRRRSKPYRDPQTVSEFERLDDAIKPYVTAVRETYIVERETYHSLRNEVACGYVPPKSYEGAPPIYGEGGVLLQKEKPSTWIRLASWFAKHRVNPKLYISTQFSRIEYAKTPPEPNHLITPAAYAYWQRQSLHFADRVRLELEIETQIAIQEITVLQKFGGHSGDTASLISLANPNLSLSALFRYCLACSIPDKRMQSVMDRFRSKAYVQFCEQEKYYVSLWSAILPKGFADEARRHYDATYASLIVIGVE